MRSQGGTGSWREPHWEKPVDEVGRRLDEAMLSAVGDLTLVDLIDKMEQEPGSASAAGDGHPVDED